jgi:hypothetical protein
VAGFAHARGHRPSGHSQFEFLGVADRGRVRQRLAGRVDRQRVAALERALGVVRAQRGGVGLERGVAAGGQQALGALEPA